MKKHKPVKETVNVKEGMFSFLGGRIWQPY